MTWDHSHVPDAVAAGASLAYEDFSNSEVLDEFSRTSVGESHTSYPYRGKHWALAIDTAAGLEYLWSPLIFPPR